MERILAAVLGALAVTPAPVQDGQAEAPAHAPTEATEPEVQTEGLAPSDVDLDLLRFGLEEIRAAVETGDAETVHWHVRELARLLAEAGGVASEEEMGMLSQLEATAETYFLPHALIILRRRILSALEARLPNHHVDVLQARRRLAGALSEGGDLEEAQSLFESVLADCERTLQEDHPLLLQVQLNLGSTMRAVGDHRASRALAESALAGYERTLPADHRNVLFARYVLASTLMVMGEPRNALVLLESVLEGYKHALLPEDPYVLIARGTLASALHMLGDLHRACSLYESALAALERTLPTDHRQTLFVRGNLANALLAMGEFEGARSLLESTFLAMERRLAPGHPDLLKARMNLSAILYRMGDIPGAHALNEAVLEGFLSAHSTDRLGSALARGNLALTMKEMGDLEGARSLEESVLTVRGQLLPDDHPDLLLARGNLAWTLERMGETARARLLRESVLEAKRRTLPVDHLDLLRSTLSVATSRVEVGDLPGARSLVPDLIEGLRARALGSLALAPRQSREIVGNDLHLVSGVLFLVDLPEPSSPGPVFELLETMRTVAGEAARAVRRSRDPEIDALMLEARDVRADLSDLLMSPRPGREQGDVAVELASLMRARDRLEGESSRKLAELGVMVRPTEIVSLAAGLSRDSAAVGYLRVPRGFLDEDTNRVEVGEDHLLAHVLRADGSVRRIDLGPAAELERLVAVWRADLGRPILGRGVRVTTTQPGGGLASGDALRARLIDPVLVLLPDDVRRLHVCADDLVFLVPLDALSVEGGVLGDRLQIVNEVSFARILSDDAPADTEPSLLLIGGVDYDAAIPKSSKEPERPMVDLRSGVASFGPLPGTRAEVDSLARLFAETFEQEATMLVGPEATKPNLAIRVEGLRNLHIATHGWFAPEAVLSQLDDEPSETGWIRMGLEERVTGMAPMLLCGLALAGANQGRDSLGRMPGLFTAEELCSLDLSACDLAVLSACETNVGIRRAGQGIQSLQAALYAAGARSSITSLWKVDDAATRRLMEIFYTNLWEKEMPKAEALWEAKKVLREEGAPVRDWAGWVLTGDPN